MIRKVKSYGCGVLCVDGAYKFLWSPEGGTKMVTVHTRMDLLENCHRVNRIFVLECYDEVDDGN